MVHVHGRRVQQLVEPLRRIPPEQVIAVGVEASGYHLPLVAPGALPPT